MAETILVLEDDPAMQSFLVTLLKTHQHPVVSFSEGLLAMQHLVSQRVDLVLLDLGLVDLDGQSWLQQIRQWTEVPVIVISARHGELKNRAWCGLSFKGVKMIGYSVIGNVVIGSTAPCFALSLRLMLRLMRNSGRCVLFAALLLLAACQKAPVVQHFSGEAQGSTYNVSFWLEENADRVALQQP